MRNKYKRKREKKNKKNRIILFLIILFLIIISIFFSNYLKNKTINFNYYLNYPIKYIKEKISDKTIIKLDLNKELEQEVEELKKLLELKNIYTDYHLVNATVISRNKSYWFNELIIDKGKKDNIEVDMAVITSNGLIGKIIKVYDKTAVVKMITNNDTNNKISVGVEGKDGLLHGIITNYDSSKNYIIATGITTYDEVSKDREVITTGLGVFPKGIKIGTVKNIEKDNYNISKILYIKPYQDMNNIEYVSVLGNKTND